MWKWLEKLFYNKALITAELVEKDEALRQCYDAWMDDRSLLNGARLELKTAREKIDELQELLRSQDDDMRKIRADRQDILTQNYKQGNTIAVQANRIVSLETTKEEMQERIDELENEVYDLNVKMRNPNYIIGEK